MYDTLPRAVPGITNADLLSYFKDATIAPPAAPASVVIPRAGVTITRDAFGVPHVAGATRADVFFGAGYATAQDRLFFADILRHMGRGRLSEFVGGVLGLDGTIGYDRTYYRVAGHSEAELQAIIDEGVMRSPEFGPIVLADAQAFRDGINAYIAEARVDPAKLPAEYQIFGLALDDWQLADSAASAIAFCTVIGFCNGGGGEHDNVQLFQALVGRFGEAVGERLRRPAGGRGQERPRNDAEEVPAYERTGIDPAAVAFFDEGSFTGYEPVSGAVACTGRDIAISAGHEQLARDHRRKHAEGGRPIMVGGRRPATSARSRFLSSPWKAVG